jgi:hypothetical protein
MSFALLVADKLVLAIALDFLIRIDGANLHNVTFFHFGIILSVHFWHVSENFSALVLQYDGELLGCG